MGSFSSTIQWWEWQLLFFSSKSSFLKEKKEPCWRLVWHKNTSGQSGNKRFDILRCRLGQSRFWDTFAKKVQFAVRKESHFELLRFKSLFSVNSIYSINVWRNELHASYHKNSLHIFTHMKLKFITKQGCECDVMHVMHVSYKNFCPH